MNKAKVRLLDAHFDFDGAEVSYTTPEVGGAASLKNDAYMFKAMQEHNVEQGASNKSLDSDNTGDITKNNEDNTLEQQEVIKQLQDEIAAMKLEKAVLAATAAFGKFVKQEVAAELAQAVHGQEQVEVIVKALESVKAEQEAEIAEAQDKQKSELAKALQEEAGHTETQEAPVAKSVVQRAKEQLEKEGAK